MLHVTDDAIQGQLPGSDAGTTIHSPERSALMAARRWSLVTAAATGGLMQIWATTQEWSELGPLQLGATAAALAILMVGGALSKHYKALWILISGAWVLVAANMLPGAETPWLFINSAALFGAFGVGLMTRWQLAIPASALFAILLHTAWRVSPATAKATGFAALDGWIPPVQVAAVILAMSLLWASLNRQAQVMDAAFQANVRAEFLSIQRRAQGEARRRLAIAVHETLLNTIRSVAAMAAVDRTTLNAALSRARTPFAATQDITTLGRLRDQVTLDVECDLDIQVVAAESLVLTPDAFEALRAALVELVRNQLRHGDGSPAVIRISNRGDRIIAEMAAAPWRSDPMRSGLGLRTAVEAGVRAVGGKTSRTSDLVILEVPALASPVTIGLGSASVFSQSRALISMWLAAIVCSGSLYFLSLALDTNPSVLTLATSCVAFTGGFVALLLSWRREQREVLQLIPLLAIPVSIPWLIQLVYSFDCAGLEPILISAINVSGITVLTIGLWSRWWLLIPALCLWLGGLVNLAAKGGSECGQVASLSAFNAMVLLPSTIALVMVAGRTYSRAQMTRTTQISREIVQKSAAAAQERVLRQLELLITEATSLLSGLAETGKVSQESLQDLLRIEGRIRVVVQVDPQDCGSFAKLALLLVEEVSETGGVVKVGTIEPSRDDRPLPEKIEWIVRQSIRGHQPSVSAFHDGQADYLAVSSVMDLSLIPEPGLEGSIRIEDVELSLDQSDEPSASGVRVMALIVRPNESPAQDHAIT